ncbi:MAG TPA: DUF2269 family protein [Gemmatimonadales bacterium]|nr:DUF2269 family protein [Gemmatimonadales bacterium]
MALLRLVHIAGAVLLLGNVVVTGFWAAFLYRQRTIVPFRPVARAILWADLLFTFLGGALLVASGLGLARVRGYVMLHTPWLVHGIGALAVSTGLWLVALLPDQLRLERMDPADDRRLRRVFLRWSVLGWAATAALFYGLWAMVARSVP